MSSEIISMKIREARLLMCKTQEHIAHEAGLSVQTVRRAEQSGQIGFESLRSLCAVLNLDAEKMTADIHSRTLKKIKLSEQWKH